MNKLEYCSIGYVVWLDKPALAEGVIIQFEVIGDHAFLSFEEALE